MSDNITKADLISMSAEKAGTTKAIAEDILNSFTQSIQEALIEGKSVTLVGFGTFSVTQRAARKGRNPQTGAELDIAASKVAKFKAGKTLKEAVNVK